MLDYLTAVDRKINDEYNEYMLRKWRRNEMSRSEIRRSMPLFPIGIVMQLTDLSARQIRYYEEQELILPSRTDGNRRMFSLNDIDLLLEIKDLIDQGVNLAGIKQIFSVRKQKTITQQVHHKKEEQDRKEISDEELRKILRSELARAGRFNRPILWQGDMSHFFTNK